MNLFSILPSHVVDRRIALLPQGCKSSAAFSASRPAPLVARPALKGGRPISVNATTTIEIGIDAEDGSPPLKESFPVEDGRELYTASLRRPIGAILIDKDGRTVVDEVADGSSAQNAGIKVGDIVRGTTARSKNIIQENVTTVESRNKQSVFGGLVLMPADEEDFDTVLAGIESSICSRCDVTLIMERAKQS